LVLIVLAALFVVLFNEAKPAIDAFGLQFVTNSKWAPNMDISVAIQLYMVQ